MRIPANVAASIAAALATTLMVSPVWAHHGKDFLLLETDDMPQPGHVYLLTSLDTNIDKDGARSTEITPGLLFGYKDRIALEPHFHVTRTIDQGFHFDAIALAVRYRLGNLGRSEWRWAVSSEAEKPKAADEKSNGLVRLVFAKTSTRALVAVNLLAGREFASDGQHFYGWGAGVLTPLPNGNRIGVEILSSLPLSDGIEIVPGYYMQMGKSGATGLKLGLGYFHSRDRTAGTLHVQFIQTF